MSRIGIDARLYATGLGVGRYISRLIGELEIQNDAHEVVVFLRKENWALYTPRNTRFTKVLAPFPWYSFAEQLLFPKLIASQKLDFLHVPHFNVPLIQTTPTLVTIHDLIMLRHPLSSRDAVTTHHPLVYWAKHAAFRLVLSAALHRSRAIITVSQTVKQQIHEYFNIPLKKMTVTLEAADPFLACPTDWKPPIGGNYFFTPGNAYPHKNLFMLLEAFAAFSERHPVHGLKLVLCGQDDVFTLRVRDCISELNLTGRAVHIGHVSEEELSCLYRHARALVLPSLEEGFGLPLLEASRNNVPIIASHIPVFREILGDAFTGFDPTNVSSLIASFEWFFAHSEDVAARTKIAHARSLRYTWHCTAAETLKVYENISHH